MARPIIGMSGLAGSGKSTVANMLVEDRGFVCIKFAGPIKAMLQAIGAGVRHTDGILKEEPQDWLCGKTPRHAMQTLGTEWGRSFIGEDFWLNLWREHVSTEIEYGDCTGVVCDDVRFANEADAIRAMGGKVLRIERGGSRGSHASEAMNFDVDATIDNDGTLDDLFGAVLAQIDKP